MLKDKKKTSYFYKAPPNSYPGKGQLKVVDTIA